MRTHPMILALFIAMMALFATAALAGGDSDSDSDNRRIQICHFPPGNPANFHTIRIRGNKLSRHERHGDLLGSCQANCEAICDDGDPCTQDVDPDTNNCYCLPTPTPVNCDDGASCTIDSCDPTDGSCVYTNTCDDGNECTADICSTGECTFPPVSGCLFPPVADGESCDDGDPATFGDQCLSGTCTGELDLCFDVTCEPLDQCHVAGTCTDGVCDDPIAADDTPCDDGDAATDGDVCTAGICAGTPAASCYTLGGTCTTGCTPNQTEIEGGPWSDCPPDEQNCCQAAPEPQPGDPGWTCPNPNITEIFADPSDCVLYIVCQGGNRIDLNCNLNPLDRLMRYDANLQQCLNMGSNPC